MYRRSNSSSCIPLPKANLFGSKDSKCSNTKGRNRSQSSSRLSQRDSVSTIPQLRLKRSSSSDRKSSTVGLLRTTPLLRPGPRSGSLQRTTPTSVISQRTNSSRGTTPSSSRKDYVSIQKLSSDKKWVSEQYVKVQNFIMLSDLFDHGVVNATNIKPPSINNFIYVTGMLLMEIFPRVKINKENYKEVIPAQLKVLRYPGVLTSSILKTVNTMHSWPQVIGMWSWLIDKVIFCRDSNNSFLIDNLDEQERKQFLLHESALDFLIKRYNIFNKSDSDCMDEDTNKINEEFVTNLAEFHNVDFDQFNELKDDVARKKEYRSKLAQDIEQLMSENKKMSSEIEEMKLEIEEFQENDPIEEQELENELQIVQSNLKELRTVIDSTEANISDLQVAIKEQPCTYQEKLALQKQIEELKEDIRLKKEKIEHAREIKNKFDHKLTTEISKIQSLVIQWNRDLLEVSIKKPHLKQLLLREKGFHDPKFLDELQEVYDYKNIVESEIKESLTKVENDIRTKEQKKCQVEKEIEEITESICHIDKECVAYGEKIAEIQLEIKKSMKDLETQKTTHAQSIKELRDVDTSDEQTKKIAELKKKKEHLQEEVKKFGPKMLSFFVEMHNQVVTNLKTMEEIKANLARKIENRQINIVEKQRQIIEILKYFQK